MNQKITVTINRPAVEFPAHGDKPAEKVPGKTEIFETECLLISMSRPNADPTESEELHGVDSLIWTMPGSSPMLFVSCVRQLRQHIMEFINWTDEPFRSGLMRLCFAEDKEIGLEVQDPPAGSGNLVAEFETPENTN